MNLYLFVETAASGAEPDAIVEQIDIGGPAMVRAAAKNHANVAIVVSPESYPAIIESVEAGGTSLVQRRELAARAFAHTANYDSAVAQWFAEGTLAEPGRYALMCFIPVGADPDEYTAAVQAAGGGKPSGVAGGPPHFVSGMHAELQVT